ncbi:hypothetical protein EMCG_05065 [[Emmonsia] crescens]|uniref:PNPLA domain-containing protein n=1 Tax=[Emmonsia] crescens TaxID=73230 RepID=A0A0G2HQ68_9EURO|nr:hypothetical protein EMCG_05065 [Emmonsia crescens UAMH 3008]
MYNVKGLEDIFKSHFRSSQMFGTPLKRISGGKVAVTAGIIRDGTSFLITNYNGETLPGKNSGTHSPAIRSCELVVKIDIVPGYGCVQTEKPDGIFAWQAACATSAVSPLFPPVEIPEVGSFQDGGVKPQNNNSILLGLSEVKRLWPETPMPDVIVSLETCSSTIAHSSKVSSFRNVFVDGFVLRGYRFINSSYDGEETSRDLENLLGDRAQKTYVRLNAPFPLSRHSVLDNPDIDALTKWVWKCVKGSSEIKRVRILMLLSSFFFFLEDVLEFQSGLFHCVGSIWCCASARSVLRMLSSLHPTRIDIFKNDINLGLQLSEDDICNRCGRYCRSVRFFVRHLDDKVALSLRFDGASELLSQFPQSMQWFIDRQGLDCSFGLANHGIPLRVQCETCDARIQGRGDGKRLKYIEF